MAWLDEDSFAVAHIKEQDAETAVGDAMKQAGLRDYFTKSQLAEGGVPNTALGRKFLNSYSPEGGWYVMGVPGIYTVGRPKAPTTLRPTLTTRTFRWLSTGCHFLPEIIVPMPNRWIWRSTLASLLGINAPTHAMGRVLTEALALSHRAEE